MAANVALPVPVASPLGAYACAVTESTRYTGGASRVQLHRLCALPFRECGATTRRLPGRYWFKVALATAVQARGTVWSSPRWNVVTNPAPGFGAGCSPPSMTSTPATMSATAAAAPPQTQTMRDLRRERAAALRLRDPGVTGSWPGERPPSSQLAPAGGGLSSTARCPPWLPRLGLPSARRRLDSWSAHRGVTPGPAQGGYSSSASGCSSQERRPLTRESPRRPAVGGLPDRGGGDPCSATAPHFMASLAGRRAGGTPASSAHGRAGGARSGGAGERLVVRQRCARMAAVCNVGTGRTIGPQDHLTRPETPNPRVLPTARRGR